METNSKKQSFYFVQQWSVFYFVYFGHGFRKMKSKIFEINWKIYRMIEVCGPIAYAIICTIPQKLVCGNFCDIRFLLGALKI